MVDFKPFKIEPTSSGRKRKPPETVPSFPGQYKTTNMNDFTGKKPQKECVVNRWPQLPIFGTTYG